MFTLGEKHHWSETIDLKLEAAAGWDFGFHPLGRGKCVIFLEERWKKYLMSTKGGLW